MTNRTPNRAIVPIEIGGLYSEYGIDLVHVEDTGIDGEEIVTPIEWLPGFGEYFNPNTDSAVRKGEEILDYLGYEVIGLWDYGDAEMREYAVATIAKKKG